MPIKKEVISMDEDIYTEDGIEEMFDDDSLAAEEYGFMLGYIQAE